MSKLNLKRPTSEEGFSILEVLVSGLVLVGFFLGTLQAATLATLVRVQAQRKTEAVNYINNDKELIEYQALLQPINDNTNCDITTLRNTIASTYPGTNNDTPTAGTIVASNVSDITFVNKGNHRFARIYTVLPETLQVTWHVWYEGETTNDTNLTNPDLSGGNSAGDSDDRTLAIITTEIIPNISICQ